MTIAKSRGEAFRISTLGGNEQTTRPRLLRVVSPVYPTKFPTIVLRYKHLSYYTGDSSVPRTEPQRELQAVLFAAPTGFKRAQLV